MSKGRDTLRLAPRRSIRVLVFSLAALLIIVADQLSKVAIRAMAPTGGWIGPLVPGVLNLTHVENTGAAFGIGTGASAVFVVVALVVAVGTLIFVIVEEPPLSLVTSLAFVAGGGIGNLIDRVTHGSVTDFLSTAFIAFPVFNVADIFVTLGVILSVISYAIWEYRRSTI